MLEIINFVFPISASMESSSMWRSDSDSVDNGCLENITDLSLKMNNTPPSPCGVVMNPGFLGF